MNTHVLIKNLKQKITPAKIFLFITLCLVIFVRLRLLSMPLDRDEGCWAYGGQLLLEGNPPYKYFYEVKMPGIYFLYAFIMMIFGQTIEGIRAGILLTVLVNMVLVYKLFIKFSNDSNSGLLACSFYGLLTLDRGTLALSGYSSHFVLTFVMLSLIFVLNAIRQGKSLLFFIGGFFAGMAFLVKQPAVFFVFFILIYILLIDIMKHNTVKKIFFDILSYLTGALSIFMLVCLLMKINGVFDRFWFMTIKYAFKHGNMVSLYEALIELLFFLKTVSVFFNTTLFLIILYIFFVLFFINEPQKKIFYIILFLSCAAFSFAGFYFRSHYFIVFFLPMSLIFVEKFYKTKSEEIIISDKIKYLIFIFLLFLLLITQYNVLFKLNPSQVSREIFKTNPFPESIEIANFIKANTNKDDRIAIFGSESQIFFYAKRKSATGYTSFIHLMDRNELADKMQIEAIKEITEAKPKYFIYINIRTSWAIHTDSSRRIIDWFNNKINKKELELVGLINIISPDKTEYVWGKKDVEKYRLRSPYWVAIFKAKQ